MNRSGEYTISQSIHNLLYGSLMIQANYLPVYTSAHHTLPLEFEDHVLLFLVWTRTFLGQLTRTTIGYLTCIPLRFFHRFLCHPYRHFPLCISNTPTWILKHTRRVLLPPLCNCCLTIALRSMLLSPVPSMPDLGTLSDPNCAYSHVFMLDFSVLG